MPYDGPTPTKLGRIQSPPPMQLHRLHVAAAPAKLREVSHPVPVPVLDQEAFGAQGIDVTALVKGAQPADALGNCVYNAMTAHVAERTAAAGKDLSSVVISAPGCATVSLSATDARQDEEFAIVAYHAGTDQTGNPATEWPPTDGGSSGYDACTLLERLKLASTYKTGSGVLGALSMLQAGTVMEGKPWFRSWFQPDSQGFIDGDGSADAFRAALDSGVAGGHETLQVGIPQLAVTASGQVDLQNTVIEELNSWSASWGPLGGRYRIHASTLAYLAAYADWKQAVI